MKPNIVFAFADDWGRYAHAYANVRQAMEQRLLSVLREQNDPRLMEQPCRYEFEPYAGPLADFQKPDG